MSGASRVVAVLAWRNLWRNYRRTLVMLLAIGTGVWAMIFMSSLMRGMTDQMVLNGLAVLPGEVQIHHPSYRNDPSVVNSMSAPGGDLLAALEKPPVTAWAARVRVPAVIASERDNRGVTLLGVDPSAEQPLGSLPDEIVEGRFLADAGDRGVVLGASLARKLDTQLGKRVVIMSQDPQNNVADRGSRVVGIYRARLASNEEQFVYAGRDVLQEMLGIGDAVSEIAISAGDYRQVALWAPAIIAAAGPDLEVLTWMDLDAFLASMLNLQDGFTLILMVVVFLVLSFGLVNTLAMAVFERVREIGLMQALGMRPSLILYQLLLESLYLLLLGLAAGNLLAWVTIKPLESGIDISGVAQGMEMMGMGTTLYPALAYQDMLMSTVVVIVLGLLASLLPAWRAARLDPVRALNKT
ncbi:ABC transporter permease [Pseudohalioglobus lutimaris]|uniref:ABC transporter permease n=1 Tax=Pseudohalioglobus lutimaris TaxID=1737061 RepID=A0A2N5X1Y2_9GAMM|nr:ABC transporter permease [Pseudohalioglobus lutimaris]PLW68470.1 ABC transporter permease [Pseudohalioglobus lutimaris]